MQEPKLHVPSSWCVANEELAHILLLLVGCSSVTVGIRLLGFPEPLLLLTLTAF